MKKKTYSTFVRNLKERFKARFTVINKTVIEEHDSCSEGYKAFKERYADGNVTVKQVLKDLLAASETGEGLHTYSRGADDTVVYYAWAYWVVNKFIRNRQGRQMNEYYFGAREDD